MEAFKQSILCVDDNEDSRELLTYLLKENGYTVTACKSLEDCLAQVEKYDFSAIVMDNRLGNGTSLEACREIRLHRPKTPIIFYSGEGRKTEIRKAFEAGATDYLVKPLGLDSLIEIIDNLARKSQTV